jgi:hypothetical protein
MHDHSTQDNLSYNFHVCLRFKSPYSDRKATIYSLARPDVRVEGFPDVLLKRIIAFLVYRFLISS